MTLPRLDIVIRPAAVADAESILVVQRLAYESEARLYDDWSIPPLRETLTELRDAFDEVEFLAAWQQTRLVGAVRGKLVGEACHVGRLVVHPDLQGYGVGRRLLLAIEEHCPAVARFELFTGSRSERNLYLYRSLNYRQIRVEQLSAQVTLIHMEKHRAPGMDGSHGL